MPLQLTPVDRKIMLVAAGVFIAMVGAALLLIPSAGSGDNVPSSYSTSSGGC